MRSQWRWRPSAEDGGVEWGDRDKSQSNFLCRCLQQGGHPGGTRGGIRKMGIWTGFSAAATLHCQGMSKVASTSLDSAEHLSCQCLPVSAAASPRCYTLLRASSENHDCDAGEALG